MIVTPYDTRAAMQLPNTAGQHSRLIVRQQKGGSRLKTWVGCRGEWAGRRGGWPALPRERIPTLDRRQKGDPTLRRAGFWRLFWCGGNRSDGWESRGVELRAWWERGRMGGTHTRGRMRRDTHADKNTEN